VPGSPGAGGDQAKSVSRGNMGRWTRWKGRVDRLRVTVPWVRAMRVGEEISRS